MQNLSFKLKQMARQRGLTLRGLAVNAGLAASQVHNLASGVSLPTNVRLGTAIALLETYPELTLADFGYRGALRLGR